MSAHLLDGRALNLLDARNRQKALDRNHTLLFLDEFAARYPRHRPANPAVSDGFIARVVAAINRNARITPAAVATALDNTETALLLTPTARPVRPAPATSAERLVAWLDERRGTYTWQGEPEQNMERKQGITSDFRTWLTGDTPLTHPPGVDTRLICWEVVLLAAASLGIYTLDQLRTAYADNLGNGVLSLFSTRGVHEIRSHAQSGFDVANQIPFGNVIMIQSTAAIIDHVVVVTAPNPANASQIEVLSLWNAGTGGVLGRTPLEPLLFEAKVIRHAAL